MPTFTRHDKTRKAFPVHQLSPNVIPLDTTKCPVTYSTSQLHTDCCLRSPDTTFHRFQGTAYQPSTHVYQVALTGDVVMLFHRFQSTANQPSTHECQVALTGIVMLFCLSFTQSERFFQTDQLIIRLQVVVMTNFIRMLMRNEIVNVFRSDAVIWWAAISRTPHRCSPNCWHLSKFESFAMSCSRRCDLS